MRHLAALLVALALVVPAVPAVARAGTMQECRYLTQRIEFFSARMNRAQQVGDPVWEARFARHLGELVDRRAATCPGYGSGAQAQAAFLELLKLGGQAALTFFTLGMM